MIAANEVPALLPQHHSKKLRALLLFRNRYGIRNGRSDCSWPQGVESAVATKRPVCLLR